MSKAAAEKKWDKMCNDYASILAGLDVESFKYSPLPSWKVRYLPGLFTGLFLFPLMVYTAPASIPPSIVWGLSLLTAVGMAVTVWISLRPITGIPKPVTLRICRDRLRKGAVTGFVRGLNISRFPKR